MENIKVGDHIVWVTNSLRKSGQVTALSRDGNKVFVRVLGRRKIEYETVPRCHVEGLLNLDD